MTAPNLTLSRPVWCGLCGQFAEPRPGEDDIAVIVRHADECAELAREHTHREEPSA